MEGADQLWPRPIMGLIIIIIIIFIMMMMMDKQFSIYFVLRDLNRQL